MHVVRKSKVAVRIAIFDGVQVVYECARNKTPALETVKAVGCYGSQLKYLASKVLREAHELAVRTIAEERKRS